MPSTPTVLRRYGTSVHQTEQSGVRTILTKIAKDDVAALAVHHHALQPVLAAARFNDKQQRTPVTVPTRFFQGAHLSRGEVAHIETTFCPTSCARAYRRTREE